MDRKIDRAARELGVKGEYLFEAERRKHLLANSILIHLRHELIENPEISEFSYPLVRSNGKLERFVLTHYPGEISNRMSTNYDIELSLDESVEPPELTVTIGQRRQSKS